MRPAISIRGCLSIGRSVKADTKFFKEFSNFDCRFGFLTKSTNAKWFPFFYKLSVSASKFAKTADFICCQNFDVFHHFSIGNIKSAIKI